MKIDTTNDTLHINSHGMTVQMTEGHGGDCWVVLCISRRKAVHFKESRLAGTLEKKKEEQVKKPILGSVITLVSNLYKVHVHCSVWPLLTRIFETTL